MAKMMIYIPDDLKGRMDATAGVKWSPLACRAFEAKLAEIIKEKGPSSMEDVIARMRAENSKSDANTEESAKEYGVQWAKRHATPEELGLLEEILDYYQGGSTGLDGWLEGPFNMAYDASECFVFQVRPEADGDRRAAVDFWEEAVGECPLRRRINEAFIKGFALGALEVWDQVKDEI